MTIFLSHSRIDDALVADLSVWLTANGFTDVFIDHKSIRVGDKWADALRASGASCRAIVLLVTQNWLASEQCVAEFNAAWYMGKRILPLFLLPSELPDTLQERLRRVKAEDQGLDLKAFYTSEGRLDFARDESQADVLRSGLQAAGALSLVGLDPEAFSVNPKLRPSPFPGLESFGDEDADAALFFGRSREIAELLEVLRAMRASTENKVLVILGASGSGKSSLLKAGIIPRLRREAPAWIPMRVFRPGADPLLNFAEAITKSLADFGVHEAPGTLRRTLYEAWLANSVPEALAAQGKRIRASSNRLDATILLSVDQAEELSRATGEGGEVLPAYLRAAMEPTNTQSIPPWRILFTIRTDSFKELQNHPRFQGLEARGYDLRALPIFQFNNVVTVPARRYGIRIDHDLVDHLMEDAQGKDALPLLAFALQRLWSQFAAQGQLRLADYKEMHGISGLIEDAAERALCGFEPQQRDAPLPVGGPRKEQELLGARTFVPTLADVNDEGAAVRRVARWDEFDDDGKDLLARYDRWRLVVTKGEAGTVEVAHEALFRKWPRLAAWLEPERSRLETRRGLAVAANAWRHSGEKPSQLTHFAERLTEALALNNHPRYAEQLDGTARAYLDECSRAEHKGKISRRRLQATALLSFVFLFGGIIALSLPEFESLALRIKSYYLALSRPADVEMEEWQATPFREHLAQIERHLRASLKLTENALRASPTPRGAWTLAQNVAALSRSRDSALSESLNELQRGLDEGCSCILIEGVPHTVATNWINIAYAMLEREPSKALLDRIIQAQHDEGWWSSALDARSDPSNASVYVTSMVLIGLSRTNTLSLAEIDKAKLAMAIRRGALWLVSKQPAEGHNWSDYPDNVRRFEHNVFTAMATVALIESGHFDTASGFVESLEKLADTETSFSTDVYVSRSGGNGDFVDTYRHAPLGWQAYALKRAYPQLPLHLRSKTINLLRQLSFVRLDTPLLQRQSWLLSDIFFGLDQLR